MIGCSPPSPRIGPPPAANSGKTRCARSGCQNSKHPFQTAPDFRAAYCAGCLPPTQQWLLASLDVWARALLAGVGGVSPSTRRHLINVHLDSSGPPLGLIGSHQRSIPTIANPKMPNRQRYFQGPGEPIDIASWQPDDEFPIHPIGSKPKRVVTCPPQNSGAGSNRRPLISLQNCDWPTSYSNVVGGDRISNCSFGWARCAALLCGG
jgi:hypothetical protein